MSTLSPGCTIGIKATGAGGTKHPPDYGCGDDWLYPFGPSPTSVMAGQAWSFDWPKGGRPPGGRDPLGRRELVLRR